MGFLSSLTGADKAKDAAKAAALGQKEANAAWTGYETAALSNLTPYASIGRLGANRVLDYMAGDTDAFRTDPGYQFAFDEGQRAVESSGAARGLNLSGAQLKALNKYGTGVADQQFNNWFNRNANYGLNVANTQNNVLSQATQGKANALTGAANAKASGYAAQGGIANGLFNSVLGGAIGYATGNPLAGLTASSVSTNPSYGSNGWASGGGFDWTGNTYGI